MRGVWCRWCEVLLTGPIVSIVNRSFLYSIVIRFISYTNTTNIATQALDIERVSPRATDSTAVEAVRCINRFDFGLG